jgi:ATP-dependent DNA helicase RecG
MDDHELEVLLNDLESDRVERKSSIAERDDVLRINISSASDITAQPVELKHPDYPIVALQQLAKNAVMHRTYEGTHAPVRLTWFSDRVEIQNPGGPFGQVNRQNFGQPGITDYRNPHLAEAMKNLGHVQRFGMGIELARKELAKNGNLPPDFVVEDAHVLVIIRRRPGALLLSHFLIIRGGWQNLTGLSPGLDVC